MAHRTLRLPEARRAAIAAQGLDRKRPAPARAAHLAAMMDRVALLQIDSVNVVERAHFMPPFSRLGPYDRGLVVRAASRSPRRLVEAWGHEASLVRPDVYQLLAWKRANPDRWAWGSVLRVATERPDAVARAYRLVTDFGPMTAREVRAEMDEAPGRAGWWDRGVAKSALEYLFFVGDLAAAGRTTQFERRYDIASRVIPPPDAGCPTDAADQQRSLIEIAARALGVGTERCLADYFRMPRTMARAAIVDLVEDGVIEPVTVEGWGDTAYLHREARIPGRVAACALLSPFDSLVFERNRLEMLFSMRHRLEYYVPAAKRVWGYYVMLFLLGEQMVARVDLKADRAGRRLDVRSVHPEPGHAAGAVAGPLAAELVSLAHWLDLDQVHVPADGDLAAELRHLTAASDSGFDADAQVAGDPR
ncbi:MAG: winged helix DNA-binding domain-containing protein [Bifidobacteriaceae bacterium]|nr:winged helix DNA-binding domain-containing protein [Bifidobacteriaceae bacterium]